MNNSVNHQIGTNRYLDFWFDETRNVWEYSVYSLKYIPKDDDVDVYDEFISEEFSDYTSAREDAVQKGYL